MYRVKEELENSQPIS